MDLDSCNARLTGQYSLSRQHHLYKDKKNGHTEISGEDVGGGSTGGDDSEKECNTPQRDSEEDRQIQDGVHDKG